MDAARKRAVRSVVSTAARLPYPRARAAPGQLVGRSRRVRIASRPATEPRRNRHDNQNRPHNRLKVPVRDVEPQELDIVDQQLPVAVASYKKRMRTSRPGFSAEPFAENARNGMRTVRMMDFV